MAQVAGQVTWPNLEPRNAAIIARAEAGETFAAIARDIGVITAGRVWQICRAAGVAKRYAPRPALPAGQSPATNTAEPGSAPKTTEPQKA